MPVNIVVSGSRHWADELRVRKELAILQRRYGNDLVIIQGAAKKGVDAQTAKICHDLGIKCEDMPAKWTERGFYDPQAGFKRNILMLERYNPLFLLAFRANGKSNGTDHCIKEAKRRGIPVQICRERPF